MARKPSPTDVKDDEWENVLPYLTQMREDAPQREHDLREVFNALRWLVRTGSSWRMMPHDLPPWEAVYHQMQRDAISREPECFAACGRAGCPSKDRSLSACGRRFGDTITFRTRRRGARRVVV